VVVFLDVNVIYTKCLVYKIPHKWDFGDGGNVVILHSEIKDV